MSNLTLAGLNLPDNPTARRLLELIGEYQVRYVLLENGVRFTSPDLSKAKGQHEKDFTNHFLPNLTSNKNGDSSNPDDVWVLEGDSLKEFKAIYQNQLGISLGRINKLTVAGWNTAYHYLVQGHSDTAKDFSNLGADSVAESFNEGTQDQSSLTEDPVLGMLDTIRVTRLKQLEIEKEQRRQAKQLEKTTQTANEAKEGLEQVRCELAYLKEFAVAQPKGLDQDQADLIKQAFQQLGRVLEEANLVKPGEGYKQPWADLGLTMRNSSIKYDLNARLANAKRQYEKAHNKWVANGKPKGQCPKKPTRITVLLKDNQLTNAFKAAQQIVKSYLSRVGNSK
jgi:hypothetical protein